MKICGYLGECPYFQNEYLIHSGKCNRVTCLSLTILNSSGKNVYLNNVLRSFVSIWHKKELPEKREPQLRKGLSKTALSAGL